MYRKLDLNSAESGSPLWFCTSRCKLGSATSHRLSSRHHARTARKDGTQVLKMRREQDDTLTFKRHSIIAFTYLSLDERFCNGERKAHAFLRCSTPPKLIRQPILARLPPRQSEPANPLWRDPVSWRKLPFRVKRWTAISRWSLPFRLIYAVNDGASIPSFDRRVRIASHNLKEA